MLDTGYILGKNSTLTFSIMVVGEWLTITGRWGEYAQERLADARLILGLGDNALFSGIFDALTTIAEAWRKDAHVVGDLRKMHDHQASAADRIVREVRDWNRLLAAEGGRDETGQR